MNKKRVGAFLKKLRTEKGLTQERFACDFSEKYYKNIDVVSKAAISKWERGESIPNIEDIENLADFYGLTIDEVLNGEKTVDIDFDKKYFILQPNWGVDAPREVNLYEVREKQEMEIETRFKMLLKKMIGEGLTLSEDAEFDYLMAGYNPTDYVGFPPDSYWSSLIKYTKFQVLKAVAFMQQFSPDEKFWEAYKYFDSKFRQTLKQDVYDAIDDAEDILRERINNLEAFEKDMLLAAIQVENITHRYKPNGFNNGLYEKTYHRPYNEEILTKKAIKLLVDCGARLNPLLLGYERKKVIKIDIPERLVELYEKYKKPLIISVYEDKEYNFYEVENTPFNRQIKGCCNSTDILDEAEFADLERRLYSGETMLEKVVAEWVGGKTEEGMREYMQEIIRNLSLKDYLSARDERLTKELINSLDSLSLTEIRKKYFSRSCNI